MKKLLVFSLFALVLFAFAACGRGHRVDPAIAEALGNPGVFVPGATRADILATIEDVTPTGSVVLGNSTQMTVNLMGGWDTGAANVWARHLMFGERGTILMDSAGSWHVNPMVVREWYVEDNAERGTRTYWFTIYTDNQFSDGTYITAQNYVFDTMMAASPQFAALGQTSGMPTDLFGYAAFRGIGDWADDPQPVFEGVRLLSDEKFGLVVSLDRIPYWWEILFKSAGPSPMHILAPGVTLTDNGYGVSFSDNFTAELLERTVNGDGAGFRFAPSVGAGPYRFVSFAEDTRTIILEVNPYFSGTWDGFLPRIETIAITHRGSDVIIDALRTGEIDMINAMRGGININAGLDLVRSEGRHGYNTMQRSGYGHITFVCDHGPTQFVEVRQAMTWLLDRDEFADVFTGGHGAVIHGRYAHVFAEFQRNQVALYGHADFTHYHYNPAEAIRVLESGGWTLNADGGPFDPEVDDVRHKLVDGELMPLIIRWRSTEANPVSELIAIMLPHEAAAIGMVIEETIGTFAVLLEHLGLARGPGVTPIYHMFNLATNFSVDRPWLSLSMLDEHIPGWNNTFLRDPQLHYTAQSMRDIDREAPDAIQRFDQYWLQLQLRWNYMLPQMPLYADIDHDFFSLSIGEWYSNSLWDWRFAIIRATASN